MKPITNRKELNLYYSLVNKKLDEYISRYKVSPDELHNYVKNNLEEIKQEIGVDDVIGIDKVILDVSNHFRNSHMDRILKFESFRKL